MIRAPLKLWLLVPAMFAGGDLHSLAGRGGRPRFVMKDADLHALQFTSK